MIIQPAKRTESVQEYYFSRKLKEIAQMNADRAKRGVAPVINLGIGSPDGMPPAEAIQALCESARQPGNHAYQSYVGLPEVGGWQVGGSREVCGAWRIHVLQIQSV